ncbi:NADH-quinone oxidoreductase subunit I [Sporomusa sp.]|uniref:NADH-quinone oxidoreductase subunit I n=1 Tax=Sporomusa sp. TaxID=2078658 RepID=UPI002BA9F0B9|nr:4Fe-4S binding protein [Sporomusa sp.]HWR44734.1 4Fe-4S binding protein [Sporomusa sp.]
MSPELKKSGFLSDQELAAVLPEAGRLAAGPVAVIECIQDIPCNPCEAACHLAAITVGQPITTPPLLDAGKCKGCGLCIAKCPGLAIFVVDASGPGEFGTVQMPYEYWPAPVAGEVVVALDRRGSAVCQATVNKVLLATGGDHTHSVTVTVPKVHVVEVRAIRYGGGIGDG